MVCPTSPARKTETFKYRRHISPSRTHKFKPPRTPNMRVTPRVRPGKKADPKPAESAHSGDGHWQVHGLTLYVSLPRRSTFWVDGRPSMWTVDF